jgi:hypothetical protein
MVCILGTKSPKIVLIIGFRQEMKGVTKEQYEYSSITDYSVIWQPFFNCLGQVKLKSLCLTKYLAIKTYPFFN